ncbi:MAG: hypothetical protein JST05_11360 [Acidobacteria bacterium]|nr:hypothetical protein [Acidobacteriota bacterium]
MSDLNAPSSIEQLVENQILQKGGSIRNKAALGALAKLIPTFGESLHHALTAGDGAIKGEKLQLQLDLLCRLAERIDSSISEILAEFEAKSKSAAPVEIGGTIAVHGENAVNITGLEVSAERSAIIKPGTIITADGRNATNITGLKI